MNPIPSFDPSTLPGQLDGLAKLAHHTQHADGQAISPTLGSLAPPTNALPGLATTTADLQNRLQSWLGTGPTEGWILTTDALVFLYGKEGDSLSADPVLAGELHRPADDHSLNLRHTPQGWLWEELVLSSENASLDAFIEDNSCFIKISDDASAELHRRKARYQVEWRLTPAPNGDPATYRPARCRFVGWA